MPPKHAISTLQNILYHMPMKTLEDLVYITIIHNSSWWSLLVGIIKKSYSVNTNLNFLILTYFTFSRISPRHILLAIRNDEELNKMLEGVTISQGGVLPHIQHQLLPKKTTIKHTTVNSSSQDYWWCNYFYWNIRGSVPKSLLLSCSVIAERLEWAR